MEDFNLDDSLQKAKFNTDEQFIIKELMKPLEDMDLDKFADVLVSSIGNMEFNDKLRSFGSEFDSVQLPGLADTIDALSKFTYTTKNYSHTKQSLAKLNVVMELESKGEEIQDFEKLSLKEYGNLEKVASSLGHIALVADERLLDALNKDCKNQEYHELFQTAEKSLDALEELSERSMDAKKYKSGDLMMNKNIKHRAVKDKSSYLGHEGILEEKLLSEYNHAAPLYVRYNKIYEEVEINKADIYNKQQIEEIDLAEMSNSDMLRIDPTKLVSSKMQKQLEQIDYGEKDDEHGMPVKVTWQEAMRERYEQLSNALHEGSIANQILVKKERYEELNDLTKSYQNKFAQVQTDPEQSRVVLGQMQDVISEQNRLREEIKDKGEFLISNDNERLNKALNWVGPKAIMEGHSNWLSKNDHRDLSEKMFNASPDEQRMICSEYAARCVAATIDQLNKLTSFDLQAAGLIEKEEVVVKNPISKKEKLNRIHPERLVNILEKANCVEKVENKEFMAVVDTENTSLKIKNDFGANLPRKLYETLQRSQDKADFIERSERIFEVYLKAQDIDEYAINMAKEKMVGKEFAAIYDSYTKKPEGIINKIGASCIKIMEFCKIRTKDKSTKKAIDNTIKEASSLIENKHMKNAASKQSSAELVK